MSKLLEIQETAQEIAEAITAAIGIDTEIVDEYLTIVAGTGRYKEKIGQKEEDGNMEGGYLYGSMLRTGQEYIVEEAACDPVYAAMENELAEVCCPVKYGERLIGLMGLVAFQEKQREALLGNKDSFMVFLKRMAYLLASKVSETAISNEMRTVLQSINDGIIAVDEKGMITSYNIMAEKLMQVPKDSICGKDIRSFFPNTACMEVIQSGIECRDREEIGYLPSGEYINYFTNIYPIFLKEGKNSLAVKRTSGAVISIRDMADVRTMVYNLTEKKECSSFDDILGVSDEIYEIKRIGEKIAQTKSTVLITGESGTGKGLLARTLHFSSPRKLGPFITVNCGAIPDTLLESELFGYEPGAFTGANKTGKTGKFELADGGTIFLDEVGDLPLHLQVKLLSVLQQKEIQRVGGTRTISVDVRVIAATNRNLEQMLVDHEFREDLFFRLSVIPLYMPSIRERKVDIPILLENALNKYNKRIGKQINGFSRNVIQILLNYEWKGNIRELENVVEYGVTMESSNLISINSLPPRILRGKNMMNESSSLKEQCSVAEKEIIQNCLVKTGYTLDGKREAARILKISESTLYRRIKELDIVENG